MYVMPSNVRNASLTVWDPSGDNRSDRAAKRLKQIRTSAAVQGVIGLILALAIYLFLSKIFGVIVCSIALLLTVLAFIAPIAVYEPIKRGFARLSTIVGTAISFVVLLALYCFFFVPFGVLFRRGNRNKLSLGFAAERPSYWIDRSASSGPSPGKKKNYEQQF